MSTQSDPLSERVTLTYRQAVRAALADELTSDPTVLLMGEDIAGAGGVYKTSEGLLDEFGPHRVRDTPICENGFVSAALGMAVTGLRPVVEIMYSDFLPTAGDAIVTEVPKYRFMSGGQCRVPMTIRAVAGATGRFGAQHSATGESWYMALPGLKVATAATPAAVYSVLRAAIRHDDPVLCFEHRGLYTRVGDVQLGEAGIGRVGSAEVSRTGSDLTVISTMLMTDRALQAAELLAPEGLSVEVIELRWLRPLDLTTVIDSVTKTGRLLVVEEQVHAAGWGATVISELVLGGVEMARPSAISLADDVLIPYSPPLEDKIVPSVELIAQRIRSLLGDA